MHRQPPAVCAGLCCFAGMNVSAWSGEAASGDGSNNLKASPLSHAKNRGQGWGRWLRESQAAARGGQLPSDCGAHAPWGVSGCFRRLIWSGKLNQSLEENKGGWKWGSARRTAGFQQRMVTPRWSRLLAADGSKQGNSNELGFVYFFLTWHPQQRDQEDVKVACWSSS